MARRLAITALLMSCALVWAVSPARAAEDILKLVPDSALGFVVVNRPGNLDAKLQSLARELQLPPLSALAILKQRFKIQEGFDEHGTVGLIVLPPGLNVLPKENGFMMPMPPGILLISVTDYGKFFKPFQLGKPDGQGVAEFGVYGNRVQFYTRNIGGYAAIADGEQRDVLLNLKIAKKPVAVLAPWGKWLAGKDVAAVILHPGLKLMATKGHEGLHNMQRIFEAQGGENAKMTTVAFDIYGHLLQSAEKELATAGIALQLDKQNVLRLTKRLLLVPDGQLAKLVAEWHPPTQKLLTDLPNEPFVAAGGGALSDGMYEQLTKLAFNMMKQMREVYGLSEEQIKKLVKTQYQIQAMKGTRSISMLFGVPKSGQPMFSHTVMVMRVKDAQAYLKDYGQSIAKYNEIVKAAKSPMLPAIAAKPAKLDDTPAFQVTITMPQAASQPPHAAKAIEAMYGPGGKLVGWLVPANQETVVFGYVDKSHVQETIESIRKGKPGLAGNAGVAKTAALLPSHAVMVADVSPAGVIAFVTRMAAAVVPPEVGLHLKLPEFPKTQPIGMAVTTGPNELQSCVVVPPEVMKGIAQYAAKIRAERGE